MRRLAAVRRRAVPLLLALGAALAIAGIVGGLIAKASADEASLGSTSVPTLPVFVYTQYTQRIVPDYTGLWIGIIVAAVGAAVLLAGAAIAFTRPRPA